MFQYTQINVFWLKFRYLFGIVSWILTLIGLYQFYQLNTWYWLLAIATAFYTVYHLSNYAINLFYKPFHRAEYCAYSYDYAERHQIPTVDVFLPVCGEDVEILAKTWYAVSKLWYYDRSKINVYVLDDKGQPELEEMAKLYNFNYLSRPNKGVMKKAGNLKYAFERTNGKYIVVFDADFVPRNDFLHFTIPYINHHPKIGILQTPQHFNTSNMNAIEYGAAALQEDFYRIIQTARDSFGASICVGSNAVYRRTALEAAGGPAQVDHGEDVHTGVNVINAGYRVKYIPLVLATGLCPDSVQSLFKQHNRWCSSSTGMFLSGKVAKSKMSLPQKIAYYCGFMYYLCQMFSFIMPIQLFIMLFNHYDSINLINAGWFYPHIIFSMVILPLSRINKPRIGTYLASIILTYTHTVTFILRLFGRAATWVPTGAVNGSKDRLFNAVKVLNIVYLGILLGLMISLMIFNRLPVFNIQYYSVLFWLFWNLFMHGLFFVAVQTKIFDRKY